MTPTPKLRFVEKDIMVNHPTIEGVMNVQTVRVLQQWFAYDIKYPTEKGEWRDVPVEKEVKK